MLHAVTHELAVASHPASRLPVDFIMIYFIYLLSR
jgi:hypothetical protein